jgi:23S rRNA (pseudouridine1915-N3)-methyltransferase
MKIELWSLGKPNDKMFAIGIEEFSKRIGKYNSFEVKAIASKANTKLPIPQFIQAESEQIEAMLLKDDLFVILDENSKELNSVQLAKQLQTWLNTSNKRLVFFIGGAYGISDNLKARAHFKLSLSVLTFPHQLVRLIFTEQLYRAFTILNNEQYHHV